MRFAVITSDGDVMLQFIFSHSLTINTEAYIKYKGEVVKKVVAGRLTVLLQDSAPCHTDRRIQSQPPGNLYVHTTPNNWPPNSPYCVC